MAEQGGPSGEGFGDKKPMPNQNPAATAQRLRTKIIVRRLPHNLTEEAFWKTIEEFQSSICYHYYVQGKATAKKEIDSIAYLTFTTREMVIKFHSQFGSHVFVDSKGKSKTCSVEYAPFQKIPGKVTKPDPIVNTIDTDPDYVRFLENLRNPVGAEAPRAPGDPAILDDGNTEGDPADLEEPTKKPTKQYKPKQQKGPKPQNPNQNRGPNQPQRIQPFQGGVPPPKNAPKKKPYAYRGGQPPQSDQPGGNLAPNYLSSSGNEPNAPPKNNPNPNYRKNQSERGGRGRGAPKYQRVEQNPSADHRGSGQGGNN